MTDLITKENINIENKIYNIRGKQVMLDSDLAELYQVETKRINEAVKNNPYKFPNRFCFRLTENEVNSLKSKISTSKGGSSINRIGYKTFAINKLDDDVLSSSFINHVKDIIKS